ncbi:site-specific DNA-methyltransferase [Candidatus Micrarchaeota archaeon]|nr:site-specific DNA-methyltransferase [Candidatus Micrarchaeota archaeon]
MKKEVQNNSVHNGDCLEYMRTLPDACIDLIITDPPFNIGKRYDSYADNLKQDDYLSWCYAWLDECMRILNPNGSLYLFNYPENNAYLKVYLDKKMRFRRWLTWHYHTNTGHSKRNYTRTQHSILFYTKSDAYTFNKDDVAQPYKNPTDKRIQKLIAQGKNGTGPYDVFIFNIVKNVSKEKTEHVAQLPLGLVELFIKASSKPGQLVFDPFMGSGTAAVAAKRNGRNYLGCEISKKYCDIIKKRIAEAIPALSTFD